MNELLGGLLFYKTVKATYDLDYFLETLVKEMLMHKISLEKSLIYEGFVMQAYNTMLEQFVKDEELDLPSIKTLFNNHYKEITKYFDSVNSEDSDVIIMTQDHILFKSPFLDIYESLKAFTKERLDDLLKKLGNQYIHEVTAIQPNLKVVQQINKNRYAYNMLTKISFEHLTEFINLGYLKMDDYFCSDNSERVLVVKEVYKTLSHYPGVTCALGVINQVLFGSNHFALTIVGVEANLEPLDSTEALKLTLEFADRFDKINVINRRLFALYPVGTVATSTSTQDELETL